MCKLHVKEEPEFLALSTRSGRVGGPGLVAGTLCWASTPRPHPHRACVPVEPEPDGHSRAAWPGCAEDLRAPSAVCAAEIETIVGICGLGNLG
jgi:hypothetical protein